MLRLQAQGTIRPHAELRRRYPNLLKRQEPVIKLVDFTTPPGLCHNQPCKDTPLLPADRLNRYKAVARLLETGYCKPEWTTTWTCAACISSDSPVKNTSNVKVFATADKMVEGMMGVNEDLKAIFLTFQGVQHSQQWYRSFQHQMTDLGDGIKGHGK